MSQLLDRDVVRHQALVVDANPTSRSVLMQNLRSFGFGTVKQASRVVDARDMLEHRRFDLVICDYHFDQGDESGQDLLEELRREQMLPYSTVFVMVTGEATYAKVAEAAEAALDSYLVKPFSANTLFERVKEARQRKRVLKDIFEAMEAKDFESAAALCLARFEQRQLYWLYAARIGAELLLTLKRNRETKLLYDAVIAAKTVPWARLGVARAQLADGDALQARRTLETLLSDMPQYADSYDVMGKVQMEQGQLGEALDTYRTAATLTPGCILRLQHCGTLSFYGGQAAVATEMLERTWQLGHKSRLFDVLSLMLLAFLRFDAQDAKGLAVAHDVLMRFSEQHAQSVRLRRMAELGTVLIDLQAGRLAQGLQVARAALEEMPRPDFDMEAATNTLSLWSRLQQLGKAGEEYGELVRRIARRFSVSKAATEVLCAAVQHHTEAEGWIRQVHAEVMQMAEQAMNHAIGGQPKAAVETLLRHGSHSGNAKLIELAGLVAQRHRERIDNVEALLNSAASLAHRYCHPSSHIAGVRRSNRSAGGMVLRR
jgi:DNA-binding response OmpR family regulator